MSWVDKYVGLPFADLGRDVQGVDCYGLLRLIYRDELAIELPSYVGSYVCSDEQAEVAKLLGEAAVEGPWCRNTDAPRPFDVLLFRQGRFNSHLGIAVTHGHMIHVQGEDQAKIERFKDPRWNSRLNGCYYHSAFRGPL